MPASFEIVFDVYISGEITLAKHAIIEPKKTLKIMIFLCLEPL
jgi:hypothetical protein